MEQLVQCGFILRNNELCAIKCASDTGVLYYHDTSTGTDHEIVGLEVAYPRRIDTGDPPHPMSQIRELFPELIGCVYTEDSGQLYALTESEAGTVMSHLFQPTRSGKAPSILKSLPVDLNADANIPDLEEGYGDVPVKYLKSLMPYTDETLLRTCLYRALVLVGTSPLVAAEISGTTGGYEALGTRELLIRLPFPFKVAWVAHRHRESARASHTYRSFVEGGGVHSWLGCTRR